MDPFVAEKETDRDHNDLFLARPSVATSGSTSLPAPVGEGKQQFLSGFLGMLEIAATLLLFKF